MKILITEQQIKKLILETTSDLMGNIKIPKQLETLGRILSMDDDDSDGNNDEPNHYIKNKETPKNTSSQILSNPLGNNGNNFRISSHFNDRRGNRKHNAVDIAAPTGTPVYSPGDGRVLYSGDIRKRCGGFIKINHGNYITKYCHLSRWVVSRGQIVKRGDLIGYVGGGRRDPHKGASTGSHLHYEILTKSNVHLDPEQPKFGIA